MTYDDQEDRTAFQFFDLWCKASDAEQRWLHLQLIETTEYQRWYALDDLVRMLRPTMLSQELRDLADRRARANHDVTVVVGRLIDQMLARRNQ